jgi:hypothetical protein
MPTWPRTARAMPRLVSPTRFPEALSNWGLSGKAQVRAVMNMGRTWTEVYPTLNASLPAVGALLANINRGLREGTIWDIDCIFYTKRGRLGTGGGTITVSGGGQTGSSLHVSGAGSTGWLKAGDIIKVAGCPVVFDVTGDATSDIPINPPIFSGQSPSSGAAVTINPASILFKAKLISVDQMPEYDLPAGLIGAGLALTFREQPQ